MGTLHARWHVQLPSTRWFQLLYVTRMATHVRRAAVCSAAARRAPPPPMLTPTACSRHADARAVGDAAARPEAAAADEHAPRAVGGLLSAGEAPCGLRLLHHLHLHLLHHHRTPGLIFDRAHFYAAFDGCCETSTVFLNTLYFLKTVAPKDTYPKTAAASGLGLWCAPRRHGERCLPSTTQLSSHTAHPLQAQLRLLPADPLPGVAVPVHLRHAQPPGADVGPDERLRALATS